MKLTNKRSGFTLLEIIIVIIIVGVLASLALPRFFNTIEYSRSTEALNTIGVLKRAADRCAMANDAVNGTTNNYSTCITWDQLATEDPSSVIFGYNNVPISFNSNVYTITAQRLPPSAAAGDTITFTYNVVTGATTRTGTGAYSGLK